MRFSCDYYPSYLCWSQEMLLHSFKHYFVIAIIFFVWMCIHINMRTENILEVKAKLVHKISIFLGLNVSLYILYIFCFEYFCFWSAIILFFYVFLKVSSSPTEKVLICKKKPAWVYWNIYFWPKTIILTIALGEKSIELSKSNLIVT